MTLATTSSFLSSCPLVLVLALVRDASFSEAVAPKHSAKSIVDDCPTLAPDIQVLMWEIPRHILSP